MNLAHSLLQPLLRSALLVACLAVPALQPALAAPFAYIANSGSNSVSVIDTAAQAVVATVPMGVGAAPYGVAVSTDGTRGINNKDQGAFSVTVIDAASNTVIATVPVSAAPAGVGGGWTRTFAYVGNR